jgi:hypothetical protein
MNKGDVMGKSIFLIAASVVLTTLSFAQAATPPQAGAQATASGQTGVQSPQASASSQSAAAIAVHATLDKSVDAKKAKPGDQVVAKTSQDIMGNGQVVIPHGSKIVGHVTQAQAKNKEQPDSLLGIAFDHAVLKDGQQIPLNVSIQAIAPAIAGAAMADDSMSGGPAPGGMSPGGSAGMGTGGGAVGRTMGTATGTVGTATNDVGNATGGTLNGATSTVAGGGVISANSRGVVGLNGLTLAAGPGASSQGSVISSNHQNVHLDSGTQLILQISAGSASR